ncbi:hypothetical protein Sjap_025487 [Stephania japonica]|uniref:Uncharacterized protein n=1 Tax=Stephania japonica TaxID=461633 RepID=A0AAP0E1V8_9MAGN
MSISLISSPNLSSRLLSFPISRRSSPPQFHSLPTEELPKAQSRLNSYINFSQPIQSSLGLYPRRNLGFLVNVGGIVGETPQLVNVAVTSFVLQRLLSYSMPGESCGDGNEAATKNSSVPFPLVAAAAAAIGIHVAAKWIRYR